MRRPPQSGARRFIIDARPRRPAAGRSRTPRIGVAGAQTDGMEHGALEDTEALVGGLASAPRLFRPSGGRRLDDRLFNAAAVRHLAGHGCTVALRTSVPRDCEDPDGWVGRAVRDCRAAGLGRGGAAWPAGCGTAARRSARTSRTRRRPWPRAGPALGLPTAFE